MRESNEKTDGATKIARHSIGKRNACLLETLCHLHKNQRATFLRTADEKFICCIRKCVCNTFKGNVPLERREKNRLSKYKTALRPIAAKCGNWKDKRKLVQRSGFLYYQPHIIELFIVNYQRSKIVKIKHYRKGKKDGFNFYRKSRRECSSNYISVLQRLLLNRRKMHCCRRR